MPSSATALLPRSTLPGPAPVEQKKGGKAFRLPLLDGVPVIAPIIMSLVVIFAGAFDAIPANMIGGLAVITGFGMLTGPLGDWIPGIKKIGGGSLLCLLVPSVLAYFHVFNASTLAATTALLKDANFLYFVICTLVVGSILGMHRATMLQALAKIFPPLIAGTLASVTVGLAVAMAFGYSLKTAFFYIVVPILGGGMGEGVIPLSAAYSATLGGDAGIYLARPVPAVVIANIVAIISAGMLRRLGDKKPWLDGHGELVKDKNTDVVAEKAPAVLDAPKAVVANHAAGVMTICTMYVAGTLLSPLVHLPAPILVIIFSVILKVLNIVPESLETSARAVYAIISKYFVFPLMFGVSMILVPLESIISVLSVGYVITCIAVVLTMGLCGFFVGKAMGMYPVDMSLVTLCHSGQGGTGDVAILSAANRMVLMPFAQCSTRIGGVVTVITAASLIHLAG